MTPLLWACEHGQVKCVEVLIEAGCDLTARDIDGQSGADLAAAERPPHQVCRAGWRAGNTTVLCSRAVATLSCARHESKPAAPYLISQDVIELLERSSPKGRKRKGGPSSAPSGKRRPQSASPPVS